MIGGSHNPAKIHPYTKKIKKVTLQHAPENPEKVFKSVCKSQNVCLYVIFIFEKNLATSKKREKKADVLFVNA